MTNSIFKFAKYSLLGAAALGAVGCSTGAAPLPPVYEQHKIPIIENIERLEIYTPANEAGLTMADMQALGLFLDQYMAQGQGGLYINRPMSAGNMRGADQALGLVHKMMRERRISAGEVSEGSYNAGGAGSAPIVLSYRTLQAGPMECNTMSDITRSGNNQPLPEFGCVSRANLAAMISDPTQLVTPLGSTAPDTTRRIGVLEAYRNGETTASAINPDQQVGASDVQ